MSETFETNEETKKILVRVLRVMFPHESFGDGPYERSVDAILSAASQSPAQTLVLRSGINELDPDIFDEANSDDSAVAYLKAIEGSQFFSLIHSNGLVALYNDHEVWKILGYEGPSYDLGGYIERGFNDLDWLPEPRITEYSEEAKK